MDLRKHDQAEVDAKYDQQVPKDRVELLILPGLGSRRCNHWVSLVAAHSSQPVDWHYVNRRNHIYTTGDPKKVAASMKSQWLALYELFLDQHIQTVKKEMYSHRWIRIHLSDALSAYTEE